MIKSYHPRSLDTVNGGPSQELAPLANSPKSVTYLQVSSCSSDFTPSQVEVIWCLVQERLFSQGNVWILPLFLSEDVSRKVGCLLRLVLEKGLLSGPSICSVDQ